MPREARELGIVWNRPLLINSAEISFSFAFQSLRSSSTILDTPEPRNYGAPGFGGCPEPLFLCADAGFAMSGDDARRGGKRGSGSNPDGDLSERLKRLETQLDRRRETAPDRSTGFERSTSGPSALGRAFRMSAEFVAGVIAGGGLGWLFDRALGTSPWGMIVFLMLGFGAGVYNVMRASGFLGPSSGPKP